MPPSVVSSNDIGGERVHRFIAAMAGVLICVVCVACAGPQGHGTATGEAAAFGVERVSAGSATASDVTANPGIGHIFLIVLENETYKASYVDNPNDFLGKKLQTEGTLLTASGTTHSTTTSP
jgi:hypothetical protein